MLTSTFLSAAAAVHKEKASTEAAAKMRLGVRFDIDFRIWFSDILSKDGTNVKKIHLSFATFSHLSVLADFNTASQTYCVSKASRNVGLAGFLFSSACKKSAT